MEPILRNGSNLFSLCSKGKGKARYVTNAIPKPTSIASTYDAWDVENFIVMVWFINSMEPKIEKTNLFYKTTKDIWDYPRDILLLEKHFTVF